MHSGNTYQCPSCYAPPGPVDITESEVDRKHVYNVALQSILSSQPDLTDERDKEELQVKLIERIEWSVRDLWRNEYLSVIQDAVKFYETARTTFGEPRIVVQHVFNKVVDLPLWKAQRALRFVTMARRANWESGISIESIDKLVACAKVAAAFLDVSCRVMGFDLVRNVAHPERVQLLLEPPGECGTVKLPTDSLSQCNDPSFLENAIEAEQQEQAAARLASQSRRVTRSPPTIQLADPLIGWGDQLGPGMEGQWKDPRECCLCHICGDDDAGFEKHVEAVDATQERGSFGLGRLLPMPDGYWVHTSCALWSSEVYEAPSDGLIHAVEKARARGGQLKCFGCGRPGATVGCNKSNCSFNYHFPCAKASGCVFTSNQQVYCSSHKFGVADVLDKESFELMKALIVEPEKKPAANDKDSSDHAESDWMPIRVGTIVVHSLGKIHQNSDGFHSENYIFPPGYFATRIFWSSVHPRTRTVYALQVREGEEGLIEFSITPSDNPAGRITGQSVAAVYSTLTDRVRKANAKHFTVSDLFSNLPMARRSRRKTFGLNGPQFFGFGLSHVRKQLELCPGIEAVVAPLTPSSPKYRFCYKQPSVESILELQRRRAAAKAELALENSSGCARAEGIKAVARSGGSGRITRALVRRAEEDIADASSSTAGVLTKKGDKTDRSVNQVKYRKMKAVPLEQRLVAKRSHIHGWGLFTKIDIAKNDPIVEYMGEVIRQPVADKREKQYDVSGEGSCYMFRLDLNRIVDATMIGCMARFMNHACTPNAYAKIITVDTPEMGTERKIVVFANRDIAASEEITCKLPCAVVVLVATSYLWSFGTFLNSCCYSFLNTSTISDDYKFPVEDGSLRCTCGSPNCIGRLN
jgi:F/Y-rich N-terminus/SET domain/PHD-like zinc-binding domain/F/Y rich C-terminus